MGWAAGVAQVADGEAVSQRKDCFLHRRMSASCAGPPVRPSTSRPTTLCYDWFTVQSYALNCLTALYTLNSATFRRLPCWLTRHDELSIFEVSLNQMAFKWTWLTRMTTIRHDLLTCLAQGTLCASYWIHWGGHSSYSGDFVGCLLKSRTMRCRTVRAPIPCSTVDAFERLAIPVSHRYGPERDAKKIEDRR